MINFNVSNKVIVEVGKLIELFNSIGFVWYGFENISVYERDTFENKLNISFHKHNDKVMLFDLNYNYCFDNQEHQYINHTDMGEICTICGNHKTKLWKKLKNYIMLLLMMVVLNDIHRIIQMFYNV